MRQIKGGFCIDSPLKIQNGAVWGASQEGRTAETTVRLGLREEWV